MNSDLSVSEENMQGWVPVSMHFTNFVVNLYLLLLKGVLLKT